MKCGPWKTLSPTSAIGIAFWVAAILITPWSGVAQASHDCPPSVLEALGISSASEVDPKIQALFKEVDRPNLGVEQIPGLRTTLFSEFGRLDAQARKQFRDGVSGAKKFLSEQKEGRFVPPERLAAARRLVAAHFALTEIHARLDFLELYAKASTLLDSRLAELEKAKQLPGSIQATSEALKIRIHEKMTLDPNSEPFPTVDAKGRPLTDKQSHELWKARKTGIRSAQLEGQVADHVDKHWGDIVGFNEMGSDANGAIQHELDIHMRRALIEVTSAHNGKTDQILEHYFSRRANPGRLPVILFAPNYYPSAGAGLMKDATGQNLPLVIVHSEAELDRVLGRIYQNLKR